MATNNQSLKSIEVKSVIVYDVDGDAHDLTKVITGFFYYENIFQPFVTGVMNVADAGNNFIGTLPIQGGERVTIEIKDSFEDSHEYEMYIWKVYNRTFTKSLQTYNLALISKEALYNEGVRLTEILKGTPDTIAKKILKDYLNTGKDINVETSKYQVIFYPNGKKAHSIIQSLAQKAVPSVSSSTEGNADKTTSGGTTGLSGDTKKASGTAGYLFFENKDGFNFKSIDYYYSTGDDKFGGESEVATYTARPAKSNDRYTIEEYKFSNEIDLLEQMRSGAYASHLVLYNYSTGFYEEYRYNMQENFSGMAHLGSQSKLGSMQETLSINPSRVMSIILDHETFHSDEKPGSPDERDNDGGSGADYPDYQKYWLAQSMARRYFMENQKMEITVPGNMNLKVGDKIKVMLPNMAAESLRKEEKYDRENSGTYLISAISHNNIFLNNSTCTTQIELIRDIYGMKDYTSNVK